MSNVLEVDVQEMDCRFALVDNVFGKCNDDFTMRCPDDLKQAFAIHAQRCGQSAAWRARFWIAVDAYGVDHVTTLLANSFPVAGPAAHAAAKAIVGAMVAPLVQSIEQTPSNRRATD